MCHAAQCCLAICCALLSVPLTHAAVKSDSPLRQTVTVVLDMEHPDPSLPLKAMRHELSRIFDPAGLDIDLQTKGALPQQSNSGDLLQFKMKGSCTMNALPIGALSDERGALAMTYSVDGQVLGFGEVECDRVRGCILRALGIGNPAAQEPLYGQALARVVAHELYHMLVHSSAHTRNGVAKESLSGWDLSREKFSLSDVALQAVCKALARYRKALSIR